MPRVWFPGIRWSALFLISVAGTCLGQSWQVGTSPHFEILSGASERETRKVLVELERFRENVLGVFPMGDAHEPKVRVYLFPSRKAFRPYMPAYDGKPKDVDGYFVGSPDESIIALLPAKEASELADPVETIYHEYFHLLTHSRGLEFPLWLEEGLAEVFATLRVDKKYAEIGAPNELYASVLAEMSMLPTEQLIAVTRTSPLYNEELRGSLFYAQAWAFVHYLFCGTDKGNLEKLSAYIAGLQTPGADARALFQKVFGDDFGYYDMELRHYLSGGRYRTRRMPARSVDETRVEVRAASDFERDVALANLQFRVHQTVDVAGRLHQLQETEPGSPRPFEVLGAIAGYGGAKSEMLNLYRAAAERGSDNAFVYLTLARDVMRHFDRANFDQRLTPSDAFDVQRWIDRALTLRPGFAEAIELLAEVESRAPTMRVHAINRVQSAVSSLPKQDRVLLALAVIRMRAGDAATATQIVDAILQSPENDLEVKNSARLLRFQIGGEPAGNTTGPESQGGIRAGTLRDTSNTLKQGVQPIGPSPTFGEPFFGEDRLAPKP